MQGFGNGAARQDDSVTAVLAALIREDETSRAALSRSLGLSKPTVSQAVGRLIAWGLVREEGPGDNPVGKKATRIAFNRRWAFVAGVDIGNFMVRTGLFDLAGERLGLRQTRIHDAASGPALFGQVERDLAALLGQAGIPAERLAAVTIGIPGVRDENLGLNRLAPFMTEWEDQDLTRGLEERICSRVTVANNVNLGMTGERWLGNARGARNAVYLEFGIGVGAGILVDGRVISGSTGAAGEIAYALFEQAPRRDAFEPLGAFEQVLSTRSILSEYRRAGGSPLPADPAEAVARVFALREEGESAAVAVTERALELTCRALVSLAAILNPEVMIIGGGMGSCLMAHARRFEDALARYTPYPPALRSAGCGSTAVVCGAARQALDDLGAPGLIALAERRESVSTANKG
ncbi:MAG: ROK family transcriptional regulator [Christensenellales bacterium]|jgi:predicted NBD/HSP70 family sugar kinase